MHTFLRLPKTSKASYISLKDIAVHDLCRFFASLVVMLPLVYGIGWLVGSSSPERGPLDYYVQVFFTNNPLVELIMVAAACAVAIGLKPSARFWSTTIVGRCSSRYATRQIFYGISTSAVISASSPASS